MSATRRASSARTTAVTRTRANMAGSQVAVAPGWSGTPRGCGRPDGARAGEMTRPVTGPSLAEPRATCVAALVISPIRRGGRVLSVGDVLSTPLRTEGASDDPDAD